MPFYFFDAVDGRGRTVSGSGEAADVRALQRELQLKGLSLQRYREGAPAVAAQRPFVLGAPWGASLIQFGSLIFFDVRRLFTAWRTAGYHVDRAVQAANAQLVGDLGRPPQAYLVLAFCLLLVATPYARRQSTHPRPAPAAPEARVPELVYMDLQIPKPGMTRAQVEARLRGRTGTAQGSETVYPSSNGYSLAVPYTPAGTDVVSSSADVVAAPPRLIHP